LNYKFDTPLPWEGRKPITIMAFRDALQEGTTSIKLGPKTLRRSGNALPNVYINEAMKYRQQQHRGSNPHLSNTPAGANGNEPVGSRAISIDLRTLEFSANIQSHLRHAETVAAYEEMVLLEQQQLGGDNRGNGWGSSSRFLPSRPDEYLNTPTNQQQSGNGSKRPSSNVQNSFYFEDSTNTKARSSITSSTQSTSSDGNNNGTYKRPSNAVTSTFQSLLTPSTPIKSTTTKRPSVGFESASHTDLYSSEMNPTDFYSSENPLVGRGSPYTTNTRPSESALSYDTNFASPYSAGYGNNNATTNSNNNIYQRSKSAASMTSNSPFNTNSNTMDSNGNNTSQPNSAQKRQGGLMFKVSSFFGGKV
jgi:hypothetical protein